MAKAKVYEAPVGQFFDINKFKPGKGILRLGISFARTQNAQSAKAYFEDYIPHITPAKITTPTIGANFCYGDMLYMYDEREAGGLKRRYTTEMCVHHNECVKYIAKPQVHLGKTPKESSYYVPQAFKFETRASLYLAYEGDLSSDLNHIRKIYDNDPVFQKLLAEDCKTFGKDVTDNQIMFFLEEHLIMQYIAKRKIELSNENAMNHSRVLIAYPGKPPRHHVYIMQQNFFKLDDGKNPYAQNRYDLADKKLYDFQRIDLATYEL